MINKRIVLGLSIINIVPIILCCFKLFLAALIIFISLNAIYLCGYLITRKMFKEIEEENDKILKTYGKDNTYELSYDEVKQLNKNGAIMKNGKSLIDEENKIWKLNNQK